MMRCYVTQDQQEHIDLFEQDGKDRLPFFRITQDLGQTLIDLYYGDFEAAYSTISEIGKELGSLTGQDTDEAIWKKIYAQLENLTKTHYLFGVLLPVVFSFYREYSHNGVQNIDKDAIRKFGNTFYDIVKDVRTLVESCFNEEEEDGGYTLAERYREASNSGYLKFDTMQYSHVCTEELLVGNGHMDNPVNWDVDTMHKQGITTVFQEVLYPDTLLDLYNYLKAQSLRAGIRIRPCKHCGRYFLVIGNSKLEYCDRLIEGSTKTCRQMGSVRNYTNRQMENPVIRAYTKAYKTHNARVRYGMMTKEEFQSWSKAARWRRMNASRGKYRRRISKRGSTTTKRNCSPCWGLYQCTSGKKVRFVGVTVSFLTERGP
jgi:hypothetical protein